MKISSKFMTNVISKLAKVTMKRKTGYDVDIRFNEIHATVTNGRTHLHLDLNAELSADEFAKLLKTIGLD